MIGRLVCVAVTVLLLGGAAQAQCTDPGPIDVPAGFGISSDALMTESDTTIAFFVMGAVDATLRASVVGAAAFRRAVIALPANGAQPAQQVVFNIVFGECFRTFLQGEPA